MVTLIKRFIWKNSRGSLLIDKKIKFESFSNHYMVLNKNLNNDMEILTRLYYQMN
jgi:hypothetical protein